MAKMSKKPQDMCEYDILDPQNLLFYIKDKKKYIYET